MPRLADYLPRLQGNEPGRTDGVQPPQATPQPPHVAGAPRSAAAAIAGAPSTASPLGAAQSAPEAQHVQLATSSGPGKADCGSGGDGGSGSGGTEALLQALHGRHVAQHQRRLRDLGPRVYRHPDGSLRDQPPPPEPYTAANRYHWKELVDYCRTHGSDPEYDAHGMSLRYGTNVPREAHLRLMQELGLEHAAEPPAPVGPREGNPLANPDHPFNREWQPLVQEVLAAAPYQCKAGAAP